MRSEDISKELLRAFENADNISEALDDLPSLIVILSKIHDLLDIQSDFNRGLLSFGLSLLEGKRDEQIEALRAMNELSSQTTRITGEMFMALVKIIQDHLRATVVQDIEEDDVAEGHD